MTCFVLLPGFYVVCCCCVFVVIVVVRRGWHHGFFDGSLGNGRYATQHNTPSHSYTKFYSMYCPHVYSYMDTLIRSHAVLVVISHSSPCVLFVGCCCCCCRVHEHAQPDAWNIFSSHQLWNRQAKSNKKPLVVLGIWLATASAGGRVGSAARAGEWLRCDVIILCHLYVWWSFHSVACFFTFPSFDYLLI